MIREYIDIRTKSYKSEVGGVTFYFTSLEHCNKFELRVIPRTEQIYTRMLNQYHVFTTPELLAAFDTYRTVEQRDFLVTINGRDYTDYRDVKINMVVSAAP